MKSLTKITFKGISKFGVGPQACRQLTAVVFIRVSSRCKNKANDAQGCGQWKLTPFIQGV